MILRPLLLLLALLTAPAAGADPAAPADGAAVATVERLHGALLESMKAGTSLSCAERARRLAPVVAETFDFARLAPHLLRKHWPTLAEPQRQAFLQAIEAFAVASYAGNFARHGGEAFEMLGGEPAPGGMQRVRTRLQRPAAPPVSLDYVLRQGDGVWRIVNVIAEGVSDVAIRSAQYDQAFRQQGFDGLVAGIREQARKASPGC